MPCMSTILQLLGIATLFIAFSCGTDTGLTMGVPTSFIVCHAEALSCASLMLLQEQFCWQADILHSVYSIRLTVTNVFLIGSGTRSSPSFVYPLVIQDPAQLQEHNSTWMLFSLIGKQELSLSFIISSLPKIRIPYIQKSINT